MELSKEQKRLFKERDKERKRLLKAAKAENQLTQSNNTVINKQVNIVCLKHGTKYNSDYVNRLYNMVQRNLTIPFKFFKYLIIIFYQT
jgi:hypothetical protein